MRLLGILECFLPSSCSQPGHCCEACMTMHTGIAIANMPYGQRAKLNLGKSEQVLLRKGCALQGQLQI